ncbi:MULTISPECIES: hypothetical protein [Variovorax]|uniref:hypothetical protein n=1 Tax=Variovorax TaxID=34072 RepID=UPI00160C55BC|nr:MULTISPECIES: hypothetical protein [unclassified Variovorax]MBB3639641.1 hypothetical protein [Variovorax sp. BK613]MDN6886815.1 hypothetical protein [Variovorax sp. CAN15]
MSPYWNKVPSKHCSNCEALIDHLHVNLHRNEERFQKPGPPSTLEVRNARVLKSYCMKCGVNAARKDLEKRGFACHDIEDYEGVRLCTSCGQTHLKRNNWQPVYLIAVNSFDDDGLGTLEETAVVIACAECEAAHGGLQPVPLAVSKRRLVRRFIDAF